MKKVSLLIAVLFLLNASRGYASYVVIDAHTSRALFASSPHVQQPIASLTKMWTALVVIENSKLDEKVIVSKKASLSEGSSLYLKEGDEKTVEQLLYGLMLRSGNDAAMALAEHVGGSENGFVYLMNERAQVAGLNNTNFTNPSGLHNELHLSTAYDTARMLQIAMTNPTFAKIASTTEYKAQYLWENKHKLLTRDVGAISGKTGYTKVAGRTLATYFERNEKQMIVVTLNEPDDWNFHIHLANQVDEKYERQRILKKGTYKSNNRSIRINEPIYLLLTEEEVKQVSHTLIVPRNLISGTGAWQVQLGKVPIHTFLVETKALKK